MVLKIRYGGPLVEFHRKFQITYLSLVTFGVFTVLLKRLCSMFWYILSQDNIVYDAFDNICCIRKLPSRPLPFQKAEILSNFVLCSITL